MPRAATAPGRGDCAWIPSPTFRHPDSGAFLWALAGTMWPSCWLLHLRRSRFRGASRDAAPLEFRKRAFLRHMVSNHPDDKGRHHQGGQHIGADDESLVRPEVHDFSPRSFQARSAWVSIKLRTRRRMISLRIAAR